MMENLKVDILYYRTQNDFEMEFNLRGCCGMRLLTDRTDELKPFVLGLSRAVSRSKVIICCGKLFGEDGLIKVIAKAVGRALTVIDCSDFGIKTNPLAELIEGAVPLITEDGIFAGLIIESGPQSIILLSENKPLRKGVLSSLVHPYIQELSIIQLSRQIHPENNADEVSPVADQEEGDVIETVPVPETETEESPEQEVAKEASLIEEAEDSGEEEKEQTEKTPDEAALQEDSFITESEKGEDTEDKNELEEKNEVEEKNEPEEKGETEENGESNQIPFLFDDGGQEMFTEPQEADFREKNRYAVEYIPAETDDEFVFERREEDFSEDEESGNKTFTLSIIIIALLVLVILGALCYIFFYLPYTKGLSTGEFLRNVMAQLNG